MRTQQWSNFKAILNIFWIPIQSVGQALKVTVAELKGKNQLTSAKAEAKHA